MNKQIKEKWLKELRSNKYRQTFKKLHDKKGYCVLGVLCQIYADEKKLPIESVVRSNCVLPKAVVEWSDLPKSDPLVHLDTFYETLSWLNDEGYTFPTLADLIEKNL